MGEKRRKISYPIAVSGFDKFHSQAKAAFSCDSAARFETIRNLSLFSFAVVAAAFVVVAAAGHCDGT